MRSVKLNKKELLYIVIQNKEKHIVEYAEAVTDYKTAVIKIASQNLKLAKSDDLFQIGKMKVNPPMPVSYESSYNKAIRMLQLSVDDVIELDEEVFNQLVLDEWTWKGHFTSTKTLYKSYQ